MRRKTKPKKNTYVKPPAADPAPRYRAPRKIKQQRRAADKMKINEFMDSLDEMEKGIKRLTEKEPSQDDWTWNAAAVIDELRDILIDYDRLADEATRMIQKYEQATPARIHEDGTISCPACGQPVHRMDSNCHWCGKRLREKEGRDW